MRGLAEAHSDEQPVPGAGAARDRVDALVRRIRVFAGSAALELAHRIGRAIIDEFYDGDLEQWRRRGTRDVSYRQLARHPNLPMSATSLYRSVAIYELSVRLHVQDRWRTLSAAHLRCVLGLPERMQVRLLETAATRGWDAVHLERETSNIRRRRTGGAGRPRLPRVIKSVRKLGRQVEDRDELFGDIDALRYSDPETVEDLRDTLARIRRQLRELERRIDVECGD